MSASMIATLLSRLPTDTPTAIGANIQFAAEGFYDLRAKLHEASNDRNLSAAGRQGVVERYTYGPGLAALKRAAANLEKDRADLETRRAQVATKAKGTASPLDAEIRQHLKSLPPGERAKLALTDPAAGEAALRGHAYLSGLSPDVAQRVLDAAVARNCAADVAALDIAEEAVNIQTHIVRGLETAVCDAVGATGGRAHLDKMVTDRAAAAAAAKAAA